MTSTTNGIADFSDQNINLEEGPYSIKVISENGDDSFVWNTRKSTFRDRGNSEGNSGMTFLIELNGTNECLALLNASKPTVKGYGPEGSAFHANGAGFLTTDEAALTFPSLLVIPSTGDYTISVWAQTSTGLGNIGTIISQGRNFFL